MNKILLVIFCFLFTLITKAQTVDFTYTSSNGLYCNPSSIQFTQSASGNPTGFAWNFGNGVVSNNPNPLITYNNAGTYKVKLIVIYEQYSLEVTKTIIVNPSITATIEYDRNYICKPGVINFTTTSNGNIAAYNWDFGDGSGIVTTALNNITHNYINFGVYNVSIKATDVSGCFATTNTAISVRRPSISGTLSPMSGCIPADVSFNANVDIPAKSSVSNYAWNFNDGSPVISTPNNNINHLYNSTGKYSPSLIITTSEGCTNNFTFDSIAFGTPPVNLIAYPVKPVICGSENAVFVSKEKNANSYTWNFGDGITVKVTDTITQHKYGSLGIKNITVTPYYNGCEGNPVSFQINVIGVIASYDYLNTCNDKKTFSFNNTSPGNLSSVSWDFDDGTPVVNTFSPTHTFPSSGAFVTTLTITDNITGCSDTYYETIYTADPILINPDLAICRNSYTTFSISKNYTNPSAIYDWNVVGLSEAPSNASTTTPKATLFGYFNNYVIINNGRQYCADSINLKNTILVRGPIIDFNAPDTICFNSTYNVSNISKPYIATDIIRIWNWNFGNTGSDNNFQPQPYTFNSAGLFNVKLIGMDKNGCKDSVVKPVTVKESPFLRVIPGLDTLCSGQSATLIAFHNDKITWMPGNSLSCNNCDTVIANPTVTTKYYVQATNVLNCTSTDSVLIKVYSPFTATPLLSDLYICQNDSVQLDIEPSMKKILWSPSTQLSTSNNYSPMASPGQTTTYTATLTDSVGCFTSKADIVVHVKRLPRVDAGADKTYPYNYNYSLTTLYSDNVRSYTWTPSSFLSCSNCAIPDGVATVTTKYLIQVVSDSGCIAKDSVKIFVECNNANILMPNAFTPNGDGHNDYYFPLTRGIKTIVSFSIYNRNGKLVYEAKNFPPNNKFFGWDGKLQDTDQSTSVFVYYVEALCDIGEKLYSKGSVILIR